MSSHVPVEIWERILKYAISVPLFFEVDPVSSHGIEHLSHYCYEAEYWRSERIRSAMRCVCSSWDGFLKQYNHRYVRLIDVYHEKVPLSAIPAAIRLNITIHSRYASLRNCIGAVDDIVEGVFSLLIQAVNVRDDDTFETWELEIIDGNAWLWLGQDIFELLKERAPRLAAITQFRELSFPWLGEHTSALRLLNAYIRMTSPPIDRLKLPYLTVLGLNLGDSPLQVKSWDAPSLRHLNLTLVHLNDALDLLNVVGKNLLTCYLDFEEETPSDIWELLPHVERLGVRSWRELRPPVDHPVRYVRIDMDRQRKPPHDLPLSRMRHYMHSLPKWGSSWSSGDPYEGDEFADGPNTYTVRMSKTWMYAIQHKFQIAMTMNEFYDGTCMQFTDSEGISLERYILFAIKIYWKGGKAQRRRRTCDSCSKYDVGF